MEQDFNAGQWGALKPPERIALCRRFATEAEQLSHRAGDQFKPLYADLAEQWKKLGDAIERSLLKS